jgi:putative ATP-dependent endonuclease of OLD family
MADKLGINLRQHSVSILSTEGLNFDCFAPLFGDGAIPVKVAILSDSDPDGFPKSEDPVKLSAPASAINALRNSCIEVFFAKKTLEYDLALCPENQASMLAALHEIHPGIAGTLEPQVAAASPDNKPRLLFCGMFARDVGANVKKGEFAQALATVIATPSATFKVPTYVCKALEYVTGP